MSVKLLEKVTSTLLRRLKRSIKSGFDDLISKLRFVTAVQFLRKNNVTIQLIKVIKVSMFNFRACHLGSQGYRLFFVWDIIEFHIFFTICVLIALFHFHIFIPICRVGHNLIITLTALFAVHLIFTFLFINRLISVTCILVILVNVTIGLQVDKDCDIGF
jgi:hypothetical protein